MAVRAWLVVVGVMAAAPSAQAAASLETVGPGELREVSHEMAIRVDGTLAEVEVVSVLANTGAATAEALYGFELPADAAVTGLELRLAGGAVTQSGAVDARAATRLVADPDAVDGAADAGLLRLVVADPDSEVKRYELRVAAILPGKSVEVRVRYVAPLSYRDGRLTLRLPGRGDAPTLVRENVALSLRGVHRSVYGGGALLTQRSQGGTLRFTAPVAGDVIVQAIPGWHGRPRAELAIVPITDEFGVAAVAVVAPPEAPTGSTRYRRIVLVVDVSRSVGDDGLAAARTVAEAVLQGAGAAEVELVTFDRVARRAFGSWRPADRATAGDIARALAPSKLDNGSDLGAALELAATAITDAGDGKSLIVVVTDGVLPLGFDAAEARAALGDAADTATVAAMVLAPDAAPIPDRDGALADLAHGSGGRVVALHHGEVPARAPGLLAELAEPAPLEQLEIVAPGVELSGLDLPSVLRPGSAALALGIYRGRAPARMSVRATRAGTPLVLPSRPAARARRTVLAKLAVAGSAPGDWVDGEAAIGAGGTHGSAGTRGGAHGGTHGSAGTRGGAHAGAHGGAHALGRRRQLVAASRLGVVSQESALVAVDSRDDFGRERLELARRFGSAAFRRMPPEAERAPGHRFRAFSLQRSRTSDDEHRTGELDASIIRRLLTQYLMPRARACFERRLRSDPKAAGTLVVELELARGEVHHARIARGSLGVRAIAACVVEASYQIEVPAVRQGDDPEAITVVRYPLRFHRRRVDLLPEAPQADQPGVDPDDPLGGLPRSSP